MPSGLKGYLAISLFTHDHFYFFLGVRDCFAIRYLATSLPRYLATSLPRYLATSLPRYLATSLPRYFFTGSIQKE